MTPEAVVYARDEGGAYRMTYRGRVNNQYVDFGKWRREPTKRDLREILERLRSGKRSELAFTETKAIGCYIGE